MIRVNQAVILAGGIGARLRPITDKIPKPMAPINGTPFLDYLINSIIRVGISRILLLVGYKKDVIISRYGCSPAKDIEIKYSIGEVADLTGRRLLNAYELLDRYFLLLYGDNYWPIELTQMLRMYNAKGAKALTTIFSNKQGTGEYGKENNVEVDRDGFIKRYDKKRNTPNLNGVDIGYFILDKSLIPKDLTGNVSFEEDIMPEFISRRQMIGHVTDIQYYYITDIGSLKIFETAVARNNIKPFLW